MHGGRVSLRWSEREFEPTQRPQTPAREMVTELRTQPGRWAEVQRYPLEQKGTARSRGCNYTKRYPGVQYHVEREGDEFVLYVRWAV